jgi:outer membrane protein TolC
VSQALSLEECIEAALRNHRGVRIADRRILIARDRVDEKLGLLLPKLAAETRYEARNNDRGSTFGGNTFVTGDQAVATAKVSLLVPIYDFGGALNEREAAVLEVDVAGFAAARTRQDLTLAVSQAYYRVLEAIRIRGVVDESLKVVTRQVEIARDFRAQGIVAASDVLTAEVQEAERRQELIRASNNVELAKATLNRLMGRSVDAPLELRDVLEAAPWKGSFEGTLRLAIEARPDLAALKKQIEIARAEFRATRSGFLPKVYAFADYNHSTDDFLLNQDWLVGGVVLQVPLFDGGSTMAKLRQREKEAAEAVDLHDERVDDIVLGLKQNYLLVREAAERVPVARKAIDLGEENLRVVRDQYTQGLLTSADVLTEEDRLSRARTNYFRSLYEYHTAFAGLVHVAGATPPEK